MEPEQRENNLYLHEQREKGLYLHEVINYWHELKEADSLEVAGNLLNKIFLQGYQEGKAAAKDEKS